MQNWKEFWRQVLTQQTAAYIVFENGTCVLGAPSYAHHRLQYDSFTKDGDVIRHSDGYLYTSGGISNWVEHRDGEARDQIIERALEQRRADQLGKRQLDAQTLPAPPARVAELLLKTARQENVQHLKFQDQQVSFQRGDGWETVMRPPQALMDELLKHFEPNLIHHHGWSQLQID